MDYTIIGNEVNLAARLQSHADLGGIVLAHETWSLVRDEIMAEEQAPITVKGFAAPVRNYRVAGIYDDLVDEGRLIRTDADGVQVTVDLTRRDRAGAIRALEDVLSRLRNRSA